MKPITRRGLFGLLTATTPTKAATTRSFLDEFYSARTPEKLPPITLHPTVVEYAHEKHAEGAFEGAARYRGGEVERNDDDDHEHHGGKRCPANHDTKSNP